MGGLFRLEPSQVIKVQEVWAEFPDGKKKCVDTAESEAEALHLLDEYRQVYSGSVKRMWLQLKRD